MRLLFCVFVVIIAALQRVKMTLGEGQYTIIGPGTIHSERNYNVAVAIHHTKEPSKLEVGITGPSYNESQMVELTKPDEFKLLTFALPKLKEGTYNLTAKGLSGLEFTNTTELNYAEFKPYVKIQTDKGKYKPGDEVKFRVLFLDENLRPAEAAEDAVIYLEDKNRNRIKEVKKIKTKNGVYTGNFELSEFALLGSWGLHVNNGGTESRAYFDVEKYVLPKYSLQIEATENVAVQDGNMQVIVRANYTYGKPVNGKVLLLLELDGSTIFSYVNGESITETKPPHSLIRNLDMVNGKAKADINLKEFEDYLPYKTSPSYVRITATVEEEFTGVKINETSGTLVYPYRYHMNCHNYDACYQFYADKEQEVSFKLTYIDGTELKDTKSVVRATYTEGIRRNFGLHFGIERQEETVDILPDIEKKKFIFESHMNESGIVTFKVTLPDLPDIENHTRYYQIELEYAGERHEILTTYPYREPKKSELPTLPEQDFFNIDITNRKPNQYSLKLGEESIFTLNSSVPLTYFIYNIVGRGNVLIMDRVELPQPSKTFNLTLKPNFLMAPYGRLYAYYVDETGEFRYAETTFHVDVELPNEISITAPEEVKPGTAVSLEIKTEPHSFVGLLAVDQSVLLLGGSNDINANDFNWRLGRFDTHTPWQGGFSYYPGERSGVVTMTNAKFFYNRTEPVNHYTTFASNGLIMRKVAPGNTPVRQSDYGPVGAVGSSVAAMVPSGGGTANVAVRKNFKETWIFADIEDTETEIFKWTKKIPDTITSWVLTAFALHPEKGLGVTSDQTKIKTFQPFFISIRLPYSVKRGEVIDVPALVFNYLNKDLDVEVTLDNSDGEYEFLDDTNEVIDESKRIKKVRVAADDAAGVSFMIRPRVIGNLMLKFLAVSPIAGDAIHKTLKVVPEGVTQYANRAYFVNLKEQPEFKETFELELPDEFVKDSQHFEFAVVGDLLGPAIKNLDSLLRLPSGCGEQTMSKIVPNYLVYQYLKSIKRLTPALETRIKRNLEQGYQNILNYRHDDGSFSSFGPGKWHDNDKPRNGSTWLTAYVLRSLAQISEHIDIDDKILQKGFEFLLSRQAKNGSFVENGDFFYNSQRSPLTLTASSLLALQQQKQLVKEPINKAIKYLNDQIEESKDLLPKAIATYVLQKTKDPSAPKHVANLKKQVQSEDGRQWWAESKEKRDSSLCRRWWCWFHSNDVEITSYALLTLLETEAPENVLSIVKWLVAQRNNYGGFGSSQDTVVGLQALIKFAEKSNYEAAIADVNINSHGNKDKQDVINVSEDTGLLLQSIELPQGTKSIDFSVHGKGAALVQISYQYNIVNKEPKPSFRIETILRPNVPLAKLEMDVCVSFIEEKSEASNMAILEVSLPSGYTADDSSFEQIEAIERVRLVETKNADSVIVIYFESLTKGENKCIPIEAYKTFAVSNQKPAPVVLYDYYDTNKKSTDYYQIESKQ